MLTEVRFITEVRFLTEVHKLGHVYVRLLTQHSVMKLTDKMAGAVDKDSASAVRHCDACQSLQSDDVMCSNPATKSTDCAHAKDTVAALNSAGSRTGSTQVAIASRDNAELWASGFVARQQADEASSHCVNLVDELKHRIVRVVYTELLGKVCPESESQLAGNRWRRGGTCNVGNLFKITKLSGGSTNICLECQCRNCRQAADVRRSAAI